MIKPYIEVLAPPNVKLSNLRSTLTEDIRVIQMPVEEMCLEDVPHINVDLGEVER